MSEVTINEAEVLERFKALEPSEIEELAKVAIRRRMKSAVAGRAYVERHPDKVAERRREYLKRPEVIERRKARNRHKAEQNKRNAELASLFLKQQEQTSGR